MIANNASALAENTLVIASHNAGKIIEIGEMIAPLGLKVLSAAEAQVSEPEETGDTFEANASLKAENAAHTTSLSSLADDSGLVIPSIGDAPGIYSSRWAGPDKNFNAAFNRIQKELSDKPANAYFISVLALCIPSHSAKKTFETFTFKGRIDGKLTFPPRGDKGFGYDPIFIPNGHEITFAEMDPAVKNSMSHRARAFEQFLAFLTHRPIML